ncbi:hypothetical protein C8J57DRAFT_1242888 [Mycena rebaudengoi]|nr:hypothetical protein C8J57DRAFT_1242888 [Mycena rebaudengoi]
MQESAKPFSRHSNYLLGCYAQRLYPQNSVDSKRALSASWPSATPQSITQILPPRDFKSLHQTGRVCLILGGFELQGPATPRESLVKPNQGQLQVHYQGSGIGHDLDLDIWWYRIFNSTPVDSSHSPHLCRKARLSKWPLLYWLNDQATLDGSQSLIGFEMSVYSSLIGEASPLGTLTDQYLPVRSQRSGRKWNARQYLPHGLQTVLSIRGRKQGLAIDVELSVALGLPVAVLDPTGQSWLANFILCLARWKMRFDAHRSRFKVG